MIVGFNLSKISAERSEGAKGKVSVNNNVNIKDIEETNIALGKQKQSALKFIFEFTSKYEPSIGSINFEGDVLYVDDAKATKEVLVKWKDGKKLNKEIMTLIINTILVKCNVQALILSQQINLPPPIPLPKVNVMQKEEKSDERGYIG